MMSLLSETVPSAFRVPLELITVALLVLVLSVTTWSPPRTFFNIPGRHDSSVSPDKIIPTYARIRLISETTVAQPTSMN
jgi:hypothetical protein